MDVTAMRGLVSSCPCLQRLTLYDTTNYYYSLPAMHPDGLPHLTELRITHVSDFEATCVLAQLTGLSSLVIAQPSSISDRGVLRLTALHQLTYLSVSSESISKELAANQTRTLHLVSLEAVVLWSLLGKGGNALRCQHVGSLLSLLKAWQ
jgi:hypothetical protein